MRAREFIFEKSQQVDEIAPFVAALGGALARGAATVGGALARGAVRGAASAAGNLAKSAGTQAVTTIGNKLIGQNKPASAVTTGTQQPINIPPGTKIEPVAPSAGSNPNQFKVKIGGAELTLDLKDPKNSQILQQLNQLKPPSV
jgi:hypothetical protein